MRVYLALTLALALSHGSNGGGVETTPNVVVLRCITGPLALSETGLQNELVDQKKRSGSVTVTGDRRKELVYTKSRTLCFSTSRSFNGNLLFARNWHQLRLSFPWSSLLKKKPLNPNLA